MTKEKSRLVKEYKQIYKIPETEIAPVGRSVYNEKNELIGIIMSFDWKNLTATIELIDPLPAEDVVKAGGLPTKLISISGVDK